MTVRVPVWVIVVVCVFAITALAAATVLSGNSTRVPQVVLPLVVPLTGAGLVAIHNHWSNRTRPTK